MLRDSYRLEQTCCMECRYNLKPETNMLDKLEYERSIEEEILETFFEMLNDYKYIYKRRNERKIRFEVNVLKLK